MRIKVLPYKRGSHSASALAAALGAQRLRIDPTSGLTTTYRPRDTHVVINWGNSRAGTLETLVPIINPPSAVDAATNKRNFFQALDGTGLTPEYTTDQNVAQQWLDDGNLVVCRTTLTGHSGEGIVLSSSTIPLADAPLYVKYVKKIDEFRVHVVDGEVVDIQQKRKRRDVDNSDVNYQIRNHSNGFVYCREDLNVPDPVTDVALSVMERLDGLDFGAVDIIWNSHHKRAYALEVNTAPGLEGTTQEVYANALSALCAKLADA